MPHDRTIPATGIAHDQNWFPRMFGADAKVAVYWMTSADVVDLVGTYATVSAANTARDTAEKANGAKPAVSVNWTHSDFSTIPAGAIRHPDAREDLPAWYDEEPCS